MHAGKKTLVLTLACGVMVFLMCESMMGGTPPDVFPEGSVILFQGDSITHGGRGRDMNHFMGHGYQAEVAMRYLAAYPRRGLKFLNRGVSGDTTVKLLARWEKDALNPVGDEAGFGREFGYTNVVERSAIPLRPDYLSILVGVNDQMEGVSTESYASNLVQLIDQSLAANPRLKIILGEPFRCPRKNEPGFVSKQAFVRKFAAERGIVLVPYQRLFDEKLLKLNPDPGYWSWDGIHPTYPAHLYMADLWIETVSESSAGCPGN